MSDTETRTMDDKKKAPMEDTEGRRILHAIMTAGRSQKQIARDLLQQGVAASAPGVSLWVRGIVRPDACMREVLFRVYRISPLCWLNEAEGRLMESLVEVSVEGDPRDPVVPPMSVWRESLTSVEDDLHLNDPA